MVLDHEYIDDHSLPERYLRHALPLFERRAFELHLVDCEECADRLMLAEMFLLRNGSIRAAYPVPIIVQAPGAAEKPAEDQTPEVEQRPEDRPVETPPPKFALLESAEPEAVPLRTRFLARLSPWQIVALFVLVALLLLSLPVLAIYLQQRLHW